MTREEIEEKLAGLGLALPPAPAPVGAYVPAIQVGNLVHVSGQLPMRGGKLAVAGRVGREVDTALAREAARICFVNALAALGSIPGCGAERVGRVIKLTGYVQCIEDFHDQPQVLNGASELSLALFGEAGRHSRAAVGVHALPLDAAVELEAMFELKA